METWRGVWGSLKGDAAAAAECPPVCLLSREALSSSLLYPGQASNALKRSKLGAKPT